MSEVDKPFQAEKNIVMVGEGKNIEVVLPRLTLKKILAVTNAVDKLVKRAQKESPQVFELFKGNPDNTNIAMELVKLAPVILPAIIIEMVDLMAIYLDKPKEFIEEMDMEDLVLVSTPFFVGILAQGNHLISPLAKMFPKVNEQTLPAQSVNLSTSLETITDGVSMTP